MWLQLPDWVTSYSLRECSVQLTERGTFVLLNHQIQLAVFEGTEAECRQILGHEYDSNTSTT